MQIHITYDAQDIKDELPITATDGYLKSTSNYKYGWFYSDKYILPFIIEKQLVFKLLIFTSSTIVKDNSSQINQDSENDFLNNVIQLAKVEKVAHLISQPKATAIFSGHPQHTKFIEFGSYIVDLNLEKDDLFNNLHSKHRNVIRKSQKDNVEICSGHEYLEICHSLIVETMNRQKRDYVDIDTLKSLQKSLGENLSFYIAKKDDIIQGCAILISKKNHSSYYMWGGSIARPYTGAINLLHWQAMLDMKETGVKYYDFVGARTLTDSDSKLHGIQRFKMRFGGALKTGFLWKTPLNRQMTNLYYLAKKTQAKFKGNIYYGDVIDQESKSN